MERLENLVNMKYYTDSLKTIKIIQELDVSIRTKQTKLETKLKKINSSKVKNSSNITLEEQQEGFDFLVD